MALPLPSFKIFRKVLNPTFLFLLVALGAIGISAYLYSQNETTKAQLETLKTASTTDAQAEVRKLVDSVSQLVELPSGEDPTVATITDRDKLKDQPFFARAENGDKVLIYASAKKAILYRPSTNKILDIAPVNIGNTPTPGVAGATTSPSPTPTPGRISPASTRTPTPAPTSTSTPAPTTTSPSPIP